MALFDQKLAQEIIQRVHLRYLTLGRALGIAGVEVATLQADLTATDETGSLQRDLQLLIGIANGEYTRTDEAVLQAEQALTRLLDLLFGNVLASRALIPDDFWKTDLGIMISRVRWWISIDDMITISNAAALAFGENTQANRMRIGRAIDRGILDWIPDPSVANPQQNKRVLRPQVEQLRDQRQLPE